MSERPFEVIDHTADVGIIARGNSLEELFEHAAAGLMHFLIDPNSGVACDHREVVVEADDLEGLLVAWLNELLVLLNADGFLPVRWTVREITDKHLRADVAGEPVNASRHQFRLDVKATTYHQLQIRKNGEWQAQVIFDV
jgi:SHS2 domain-containing protein